MPRAGLQGAPRSILSLRASHRAAAETLVEPSRVGRLAPLGGGIRRLASMVRTGVKVPTRHDNELMNRRASIAGDATAPESASVDRRGQVCTECLLGLYEAINTTPGNVALCRCTLCDSVVIRYMFRRGAGSTTSASDA
jgi:hypothetical protein